MNIDLIWSPILEPDLIDLNPTGTEIAQLEPQLLPSYTVNGKLVAVPFDVPLGALDIAPICFVNMAIVNLPKRGTSLKPWPSRSKRWNARKA